MKRIALALIAAVPLSGAAMPASSALPGWLAGSWCTADGAQGRTCERWGPAAGGMMIGTSQTVKNGRTVSFEFLRIALDGETPVYIAQPGGKAPVAFRGVAGEKGVTFLNPEHDYPQRIRYWREGDALMAEIATKDGGNAMSWRYEKAD
ncbi:DUF6265 family protein [Sphingomonas sp. AOB5]|uniref:DUF6265 family protein n=1 Tax=Sphingomonas sp. AOB5 TaxID=3034017 RepID=UPI0023F99B11|nr:DUF6265 family protein [Sphingomonas sp. AOB5]MDF7777561.1 DUF6265 family protein [Sphingomonas sp. AOB5]